LQLCLERPLVGFEFAGGVCFIVDGDQGLISCSD